MSAPFDLDLNSLTVDEIIEIEDIIDGPIDEAFAPGAKRGKVIKALGYVTKRRENPDFTLEDAGKMTFSLAEGEAVTAKPLDPTDASA